MNIQVKTIFWYVNETGLWSNLRLGVGGGGVGGKEGWNRYNLKYDNAWMTILVNPVYNHDASTVVSLR